MRILLVAIVILATVAFVLATAEVSLAVVAVAAFLALAAVGLVSIVWGDEADRDREIDEDRREQDKRAPLL